MRIVIVGTGPTGLGAAWRLTELKYNNFKVFEAQDYPGGLASSFTDDAGFTWDIGGHVQFSHYKYFDDLMESLLNDEWLEHERESWIWIKDRFVPYPFQNNIRYLPKEDILKCINGLIEIYKNPPKKPSNFREWIVSVFGKGLAEIFLFPYNYKVWAYKPEKMSYSWIGERVSVIDLQRVVKNVILQKDDVSWGPNNTFKFPLKGGTGEIWRRLYNRINKSKIHLNHELIEIDINKKRLVFENGKIEQYDKLINTIPLDRFVKLSNYKDKTIVNNLIHSSVHIFGLGLSGKTPKHMQKKCWMYFPEDNCPFFRGTVFSNYSPNNVPNINKHWSLMLEVSESGDKPVNIITLKDEVIKGALNTKLIESTNQIVDKWYHFEPYGYPTPTLKRDESLKVLKDLEKYEIYSRGRFGAWKYEVSNQDHSLMQGVEIVNRLINNEEEVTVWKPDVVNRR